MVVKSYEMGKNLSNNQKYGRWVSGNHDDHGGRSKIAICNEKVTLFGKLGYVLKSQKCRMTSIHENLHPGSGSMKLHTGSFIIKILSLWNSSLF